MDTPSTPPQPTPPAPATPLRPLGVAFVIMLLVPLAPLAVCLLVGFSGDRALKDSSVPWAFLMLSLPLILGCSIAGAIQVGRRKGVALGIITFIGAQVIYLSMAFAGCVASISHMDFK